MRTVWPLLAHKVHLNTIPTGIWWDWIEPEEGKYDFRLVDQPINSAALLRPAFVVDDVEGVAIENCRAARAKDAPGVVMRKAADITIYRRKGLPDFQDGSKIRKQM